VVRRQRRELDVQVDAVEERPREAPEIARSLGRRAHAAIERGTTAPARIGGGHELEACGKLADAAGAGDGDAAVFERLAERLEDVLLELRELVEKKHSQMSERHFAGMRRTAGADQSRGRARVMWRADGTVIHERGGARPKPSDRPDRGRLDDLVARQRWQDGR